MLYGIRHIVGAQLRIVVVVVVRIILGILIVLSNQ